MGDLTTIGYTPGHSLFHRLDPRTKQFLLMLISILSIWGELFFLASFTTVMIISLNVAGIRFLRMVHEIRYFLFFLLFVFGLRTVTFADGWFPSISLNQVSASLMVCCRLLLVVSFGILLMATTRTADIRAALVWFLRPIPLVNEKLAATMVGLVVRFLPVILFQAVEISDAQRARGIEKRKNPMVRLMKFTIPLFRRVFLSADQLAMAMQARCYCEHRTLRELAFTRHDGRIAGLSLFLSLTVFLP